MKKHKEVIIGTIIIALAAVVVVSIYHSKKELTQNSFKCPESYATDDESNGALQTYLQNETSKNPSMTVKELLKNRYDLLVANHCTKTLQHLLDNLPPGSGTTTEDIIQHEFNDYVLPEISLSTDDGLYALSPADRDNFLFTANENKEYQVVVNATDDGIQNHKDLIWDDIDFWNHRGVALYALGDCTDAEAAFYHVLMRAPNDDVASGFISYILNDKSCGTTTSSKAA